MRVPNRQRPNNASGLKLTKFGDIMVVAGAPNLDLISTGYAERNNLTMRMSMRRFTRLTITNAFSKKLENHAAQVALHF